ncbi:MAG TPA: thiamine pyrophosphate-dependent enzyme, partial [Gemmatimonadales bacterium]|nr:thiamine pyrophosphate-dependent enzyme [Gemmatimonadales bacterium]
MSTPATADVDGHLWSRQHPSPTEENREPIQLVSPSGELTRSGEAAAPSVELARRLYRDMYLARRFDAEAFALQRQGELGLWLMSLGQEAAQVGSIRALRDSDHVFPSYREHAAAL